MKLVGMLRQGLTGLLVLMSLPILFGAFGEVYGTLRPDQRLMLFWMAMIAGVLVTDSWLNKWLHLSPIRGVYRAGRWSLKTSWMLSVSVFWYLLEGDKVKSGREIFEPGPMDAVKSALTRSKGTKLEMDNIEIRDPDGRPKPELDSDLHLALAGPTGVGKSATMKVYIAEQDVFDAGAIGHALSSPGHGEDNELVEFARELGYDVQVTSSSDSDVRWDPLLDYDDDFASAQSIASSLVGAGEQMSVGWTEPSRQMLVLVIALTAAEYGDFSRMPSVLSRDTETIIDQASDLPGSEMSVRPIREMAESDRSTAFSTMFRSLSELLECDIFDSSLPRFSMRNYYQNPDGVIIADNKRREQYARPFWTLFCDSAIHFSFESPKRQYFPFDELDKIPALTTMNDLVSAGRSPEAIGIFAFQDIQQLTRVYGEEMAESFWSNCPNTIMFQAGNERGAQLALSELGKYEVQQRSRTKSRDLGEGPTATAKTADISPTTTGRLTSLDPGEALITSPHGWWLGKIKEQ
jgi:hypothetical protein